MAVEAIGGLSVSKNQPTQVNSLGLDDFLKILLTQLTYQDPLKPLDNQEFIAQLAQFTSLQQTTELNRNTQQGVSILAANQAVSLIGRTVQVQSQNNDGSSLIGQVTTLRFNNGQPLVTVRGSDGSYATDLPLSQIVLVQ
ncbi:flagellar hook capping FlgD N-terminal domain-containing protein [Noviherbaspirillum pedocola]|uniref:Basal-body rod modification protein FlgD n=1 Tax=Noviherbaspirillum pedocola TaxID=2801341 RepID=A0A934W629_9BURK|nr:flagellar hook capping FlgD N-terminal domain-containing protein [Noviherbaspirillum pedocola]MBK4735702.1 flagellar hook capping protein [Noviherbaspirillum pedocola]